MTRNGLIQAAVVGCALVGGGAPGARADGWVTIIGTTPAAVCEAAAAEAKRTEAGTRSELEACDRVVDAWPSPRLETAVAYVNRSVIHFVRGETAAAIADTSAAIRLDDGLGEAFLDRAIALAAEHRSGEAIRDFVRAVSLRLNKPALAYFDLALAREDGGDLVGAYRDFRHAAEADPAWDAPRAELARFKVVQGPSS
jgi:tetratricopeptide (TPR) repeat protein